MQPGFDALLFAAEIEKLATAALSTNNPDSTSDAVRKVFDRAEAECRQQVGSDSAIDCHAGCAHCCIVNVAVLEPEAKSIVNYLIDKQTRPELQDIYERISKLNRETRWLDDEERIMVHKKCVFLNNSGSCDIYPVRPLLCRSITSTDAGSCREALAMLALDENIPIIANLVQRDIFEIAFVGLGKALEKKNLDSRSHRLTGATQSLLHNYLH